MGQLSCKSSNQKEGKLVAYSLGDVQEYLEDASDSSKLGEKKPLQDGDVITLTEKDVIFYVAGQPDDIVDGPQKYQVTCAGKQGSRSNLTAGVDKQGCQYSRSHRDDAKLCQGRMQRGQGGRWLRAFANRAGRRRHIFRCQARDEAAKRCDHFG